MAGDPSFFTLGVDEPDRARSFYGALFGWNFSDPPSGEGAVVEGCSVPGGIHGGDPGASPYLFFQADDLDAQLARVRELGGDLAVHDSSDDPDAIARFGRFALCTDDQGSSFGLHKPPRGTSETDGAKGQLTFFELGVEDLEQGRIFYEGLFGWSFMVGPGDGYLIKGTRVPGGVHGGDRGAAPYVFFLLTLWTRLSSGFGSWEARSRTWTLKGTRAPKPDSGASNCVATIRARPSGFTSRQRPPDCGRRRRLWLRPAIGGLRVVPDDVPGRHAEDRMNGKKPPATGGGTRRSEPMGEAARLCMKLDFFALQAILPRTPVV